MFTRGTRVLTHNQVSTSCVEGWEGIGDVTQGRYSTALAMRYSPWGNGARNSATTAATEKIGATPWRSKTGHWTQDDPGWNTSTVDNTYPTSIEGETWGSTLRSDLRITDGGMYIFDWWFHFGRPKLLSLFLYRFIYVFVGVYIIYIYIYIICVCSSQTINVMSHVHQITEHELRHRVMLFCSAMVRIPPRNPSRG